MVTLNDNEVTLNKINISFIDLVLLMLKIAIASIPASFIFGGIVLGFSWLVQMIING